MKTLLFRMIPYDKVTVIYGIFIVAYIAVMCIIRSKINTDIFKVLCFIPLVVSIGHFFASHYKGYEIMTLVLFGMMYMASIFLAVWPFLKNPDRIGYVYLANILSIAGFLIFIFVQAIYKPHVGNYTNDSYVESFQKTLNQMREDYILSDWKEIDYDLIEEKIMPIVKEAETNNDSAKYAEALVRYIYYFYDGHVGVSALNSKGKRAMEKAKESLAGNDYGMSMIRLDDGKTIAIMVDEGMSAYENGIHFGSVITKWNGVNVDEAISEVECAYPDIHSFPVASNEEYVKPLFLAGKGEDEIEVEFISDDSKPITVTLTRSGSYKNRLDDALKLFYHTSDDVDKNFTYKELDESTGYFRIYAEHFSNMDYVYFNSNNHARMSEAIAERLKDYSSDKRLIIDMRNNRGGEDRIGLALTALFTDREWYAYSNGVVENKEFVPISNHSMVGVGKFKDAKVAVLVNSECRSAGDSTTMNLSKLDNVTIYGITKNNGIDQNPGGFCISTNGMFEIRYPIGPVIDENRNPKIDTDAKRIAPIDTDVHIELNYEAAKAIFEDKIDYELMYVMNHQE